MSKKSWDEFYSDILKLVKNFGDYRPDIICPCMTGGLVVGGVVARLLEIKDVRPIDIERKGDERILAYDIQGGIEGKKVLLLEDDLPTGKGPAVVKKIFEQRGAEVKIAAVYVSPVGEKVSDFYVEVMEHLPDYPWKKQHSGDRLRE